MYYLYIIIFSSQMFLTIFWRLFQVVVVIVPLFLEGLCFLPSVVWLIDKFGGNFQTVWMVLSSILDKCFGAVFKSLLWFSFTSF